MTSPPNNRGPSAPGGSHARSIFLARIDDQRHKGGGDILRRSGWLGYISVDDVDQSLARLKQEGGKAFMGPQEVPGVIRFAMVADPQGAPFYIAKGLIEAPPPLPMGTAGTVGWNELMASDWQTAF